MNCFCVFSVQLYLTLVCFLKVSIKYNQNFALLSFLNAHKTDCAFAGLQMFAFQYFTHIFICLLFSVPGWKDALVDEHPASVSVCWARCSLTEWLPVALLLDRIRSTGSRPHAHKQAQVQLELLHDSLRWNLGQRTVQSVQEWLLYFPGNSEGWSRDKPTWSIFPHDPHRDDIEVLEINYSAI